jgi:hypothetical protein
MPQVDNPEPAIEDDGQQGAFTDDERSVGLARASEEERFQHDREWVKRLGERWRNHHNQDLRLRYDTGKVLNDRFGPPTSRLPRGERVMEMLAEETRLDESALNRMRWFAHRFPDFEKFKASHTDKCSWNKVTLLLVELSQQEKKAEAAKGTSSAKRSKPSQEVQKIVRSLQTVAKALPTEQVPVDEVSLVDVDAGLRKLCLALEASIGRNVTISIAQATECVTS